MHKYIFCNRYSSQYILFRDLLQLRAKKKQVGLGLFLIGYRLTPTFSLIL